VLQTCFDRALKDDPLCEEAFEALAELALERGDAELAARHARNGLQKSPKNARLCALLGSALESTSLSDAREHWRQALELNPADPAARLSLAESALQLEDNATLGEQMAALPKNAPQTRALQLAIALFGADLKQANALRESLSQNPWALHRAGVLLSSRYRFEEGAALQKKALSLDPALLPAKRALAEDLLRLGQSSQAWPLLEEVHSQDAYDVTAFNLLELRDRTAHFTRLETPHFEIRMAPAEAAVYGDRVGELLEKAYAALAPKYGFQPTQRTTVEVFPEQKDFAVRTFGVPGGDGFLGVCFGPVITAPSPASPRAAGHSWEATLWHEFTHTITLSLTHNRMPRWLSEGISMYEEQQANPAWGRRFQPRYAPRLLGNRLTPLEDMAAPFRSGNPADLDFAYLQSGLIVEWLVQKKGMPTLRSLLADLGLGQDLNACLVKRYGPLPKLNEEFRRFAAQWVNALAGTFAWKPAAPDSDTPNPPPKEPSHPTPGDSAAAPRFYEEALKEGRRAFLQKDFASARKTLEAAISGAPRIVSSDPSGAYPTLASIYQTLGLESEEAELWENALHHAADLPLAHERLTDLYTRRKDWPKLEAVARRSLGLHPMSLPVLESLWKAQSALGRLSEAADACSRALLLDAAHAPRWHSRLGLLLETLQPEAARTHLLQALEINPRDRAALQALSRLQPPRPKEPPTP
ncbi:MAG: hypothetical protein RLZZ399_2826, partial [Verrucomicrobiota bacterium]